MLASKISAIINQLSNPGSLKENLCTLKELALKRGLSKERIKTVTIGNFKLQANQLHTLDQNIKRFPNYSRNLPRLLRYIQSKYTNFEIVDIGANIGDTVALIRSAGINEQIHCVEGLKYYFNLLKKNVTQFSGITIHNYFLTDELNENAQIIAECGTAKILTQTQGDKVDNFITLDQFIYNHSITNPKFIKTDTDGFDFKIINSGLDIIEKYKPIIFLEYDAKYLDENKEDELAVIRKLRSIGYQNVLFFDNYGKYLITIDVMNELALRGLRSYIGNYTGRFEYFDICIFHKNDEDIAKVISEKEIQFNYSIKK